MGNDANAKQVMESLKSELAKGFIEETFEFGGRKWTLRTLNDGEENWVDGKTSTSSNVALLKSRIRPIVAASLRAIDGISVAQVFAGDTQNGQQTNMLKVFEPGADDAAFKVFDAVDKFLSGQPRMLIDVLFDKYKILEQKREAVLGYLKN